MFPPELIARLKRAAATPVNGDDRMARLIAIEEAIAWGKRNYPKCFALDDDLSPAPPRLRIPKL